jgi:intracellular septation protein
VWRNFSTDAWVTFKVWGIMPITLLFTFSQMPLILHHSLDDKASGEEKPGK